MSKAELVALLRRSVLEWNRWRDEHPDIRPDLSGASLTHAKLNRANLSNAILKKANLSHANLTWANLSWADLTGADLIAATLILADLSGADIQGADLRGTLMAWTTLGGVDLSQTEGLETVRHIGPSTIGTDTLYMGKGKIPEAFLRGAGVPDSLIAHLPELLGRAKHYYSCFVSHSHKDEPFPERIVADLRANRVDAWYFPENATIGKTSWGEIGNAIEHYDKLVAICSRNSLQSGPVLREIERALQREDREGKDILFPIRIDDYLFAEWQHERKADVKNKVVGDFRDPDKYDKEFEKMLKALQAE